MIRIIESSQAQKLLVRRAARLGEAESTVRPIIEAVRKRGDAAVLEFARKYDRLDRASVVVTEKEMEQAASRLSLDFRSALEVAAKNVRSYAVSQLPKTALRTVAPGLKLGQLVRPLDTVAAYIPGGRYPLPSTLMMTAIPAQAAGVPNVCVTTPKAADEVLGTAAILGVNRLFLMGGAHAIAAFAFGTRKIPRADRIVGPGNIYVAAAKRLLAGEVGIDFVAGPTEIFILADEGNPRWIAADMLAQAEHDVDASAVLITKSRKLANGVAREIEIQLKVLSTAAVARKAIDRNSAIVIVHSMDEGVELANRFAPEHLSVPEARFLDGVRHAGSVFVGPHSPEAAGDYASGPNHVLPTSGGARLRGGLSALDFVKIISVQELSADALRRLEFSVTTLARAEGLEGHARSVEVRRG